MRILNVVGARPNFMKIAPIVREIDKHDRIENLLVHTGQHYDENMSRVFFEDLGLARPDINLEVGSGSHAEQTAQVMVHFEPVLLDYRPDVVLVVGDVNSTLACSLVAAKLHVPVAHVEAGVRSLDRRMPEEVNRVLTDAMADFLFTPSEDADANLIREGIPQEKIFFVGNILADTLLRAVSIARKRKTWARWQLKPGGYGLITLHRPSNVDRPEVLRGLLEAFQAISNRLPILFPVHPRTARRLAEIDAGKRFTESNPNLIFTEPLGYLDFLCLLSDARMVLTDSGGIQTETSMLGVPCLTLRENTEWPVTIEQGTNQLVGTDPERIVSAAHSTLDAPVHRPPRPEKWDGGTAGRIIEVLADRFPD